ncbi:MAG: DUF58 domain-containing protein [Xanthomonadales bacterium]|nr:hypothetical protein [Xanthomonadales bacterium]MCC6592492.1 DUF58 domain-containing protein [Xanthomonadales bacterium]MCE7932599.1 DUF58 domain-containing protein [Xanthomonadales bacterium PRO6]
MAVAASSAVPANWRERVWRWLDQRLPSLTRRHRHERLPITLDRRRIYIVPSGFGLFFGAMMFAILAGALNYNNNSALLFGLLAVSLGAVSMLQTFRNLDRLSLVQVAADPVHAGDPVHLAFHLRCEDARTRFAVTLTLAGEQRHVEIAPGRTTEASFALPSGGRGWYTPAPVRISTTWPFGLFHAWSWLHSDARVLVYPRAETPPQPLPRLPDPGRISGADPGDEDLRSLRDYQRGDPLRLVAWKASARTGELLVRQLEAPQARETVLDFHHIEGLEVERRLSRMTRWVLDAERAGIRYRLLLPETSLGPDVGVAHRLRALKALALHALPGP